MEATQQPAAFGKYQRTRHEHSKTRKKEQRHFEYRNLLDKASDDAKLFQTFIDSKLLTEEQLLSLRNVNEKFVKMIKYVRN